MVGIDEFEKKHPVIFIEHFAVGFVDDRHNQSEEKIKSDIDNWAEFINKCYEDGDEKVIYGCWLALEYFSFVEKIKDMILPKLHGKAKIAMEEFIAKNTMNS